MKFIHSILLLSLPTLGMAETIDVFLGTIGKITRGIYHASFDTETGQLNDAKLVALIYNPGFLAMDSDKKFLYSVGIKDKMDRYCIAAYEIGENGKLIYLNSRVTGDGMAAHLAVHPSNKFLMAAQYGGGSVSVFPLYPNGSLRNKSQHFEHKGGSNVVASRQDKPHPNWTGFSPDGKFAFVPDLGMDQIVVYKVDESNPSISEHGRSQGIAGGGPRHMRFSADGNYIYLLNELTLSVTTFAYNRDTGTATIKSTTPALGEEVKSEQNYNLASEILVHPQWKICLFRQLRARQHNPVLGGSTDRTINGQTSRKRWRYVPKTHQFGSHRKMVAGRGPIFEYRFSVCGRPGIGTAESSIGKGHPGASAYLHSIQVVIKDRKSQLTPQCNL